MNKKYIQRSFVRQLDQADCGVACLSSVIQFYGGQISLEKLRDKSGTTTQGTTLLGLYQAANEIGFDAQGNEADLQAVKDHGQPLILHVIIENRLQHYIICYGYENGKFIIGDPAEGIVEYSDEQLEAIWKSKTCLTLTPSSEFNYIDNVNKSKRDWFKTLLKEDYKLLLISLVIGVGIASLGMAMSVFSQKLVDDILPSKDTQKLVFGIGLLSFLLIVRVVFSGLRESLLITQSKDFNNRIIDRFYSSLLHLPKPFFDTRKIGDLVARLNDTARIQRVIKRIASSLIIDVLVVIVSFVFLFSYSWKIGVVSLISLPVYAFLIYRYNKSIIEAQKDVMKGYALSESNYISSMQGISTIKNANKQSHFQEMNKVVYGHFQDKVFNLGRINIRLSILSGITGVAILMTILSIAAYEVYQTKMLTGELIAILGIAGSLMPSITNLALVSIPINEAKIAFNRMYEFASIEKEVSGETQIDSFTSLTIKDLSFRFPGRSELLKKVNFSVTKNELISIVGESGSGKSTLGQIIQHFYPTEDGKIIINNEHELKDLQLDSWRSKIAVVPQEITIFNGTVLDNIILGDVELAEKAVLFCREHGFEDFINKLPQSYATIVGEEGVNLSGGQKQIIAFARALFTHPEFLILDEATAAMDRNTEQFILDKLLHFKQSMGIFYISHRLYHLRGISDRIYVLENGSVRAEGKHEDLMNSDNLYSNYWNDLAYA